MFSIGYCKIPIKASWFSSINDPPSDSDRDPEARHGDNKTFLRFHTLSQAVRLVEPNVNLGFKLSYHLNLRLGFEKSFISSKIAGVWHMVICYTDVLGNDLTAAAITCTCLYISMQIVLHSVFYVDFLKSVMPIRFDSFLNHNFAQLFELKDLFFKLINVPNMCLCPYAIMQNNEMSLATIYDIHYLLRKIALF